MKEWREFLCEKGDSWEIFCDSNKEESTNDLTCLNGHPAIVVRKVKPSSCVVVTAIPASRELDSVTGKLGLMNKFYLSLTSNVEQWSCISREYYSKEEIMKLMSLFVGLDKKAAMRVWQSKKIGEVSDMRINKHDLM